MSMMLHPESGVKIQSEVPIEVNGE